MMNTRIQDIENLYLEVLGRTADESGLNNYLNSPLTLMQIEWDMINSNEYNHRYNSHIATNEIFIDNGGKNCIFQFYISKDKNNPGVTPWVSKSINSFIKYANKHGVDYFFLPYPFTKELNNWHYQLWFEKIRIYKDTMFDKYDKVLYVDTDVIVKNIENNIFDIDVIDVAGHPERYSEALYPNPYWNDLFEDAHRKVRTHFGGHCGKAKTVDRFRMINTGVLIWTKQARLKAREKFIDPQLWIDEIFKHKLNHPQIEIGDQSCFNTMFELHNFDVVELGFEWNRYPTIDDNYPCNFAHYTSGSRHRLIMYN